MEPSDPATPVVRVGLRRVQLTQLVDEDAGLSTCALVRALPPHLRGPLLEGAVTRRFADGGVLFRQGETGASLFLLLSGEVRLTAAGKGEAVEVAVVAKGEVLGESEWATGSGTRAFSAVARGGADVAEVAQDALARTADEAPALRELLQRLHAERERARTELHDFLSRW